MVGLERKASAGPLGAWPGSSLSLGLLPSLVSLGEFWCPLQVARKEISCSSLKLFLRDATNAPALAFSISHPSITPQLIDSSLSKARHSGARGRLHRGPASKMNIFLSWIYSPERPLSPVLPSPCHLLLTKGSRLSSQPPAPIHLHQHGLPC